jgi:hypothetical protein
VHREANHPFASNHVVAGTIGGSPSGRSRMSRIGRRQIGTNAADVQPSTHSRSVIRPGAA